MSDEHLRELERHWKETGSPDDEAAWLKERIRAGDLSKDQQELLGYLGCAVPTPVAYVAPQTHSSHELGGWVHGLPHFDRARHYPWAVEIYWRVGTALAQVVPDGEVNGAAMAVRLMDQWIAEPADALAEELVVLQDRVGAQIPRWAILPRARRLRRLRGGLTRAMAPARWPDIPVNAMPSQATEFLADELGVSQVREALLAEIVPWALGLSDPVRERVVSATARGRQ